MTTKIDSFNETQLKKEVPDVRPGDIVKVTQKINESSKEDKKMLQAFEGVVIARKHGKGISATITVRKIISGVGVEKVFPLHSSSIEKIEILNRGKSRRAKLYYLRTAKGRKTKLKRKRFAEAIAPEPQISVEAPAEENISTLEKSE